MEEITGTKHNPIITERTNQAVRGTVKEWSREHNRANLKIQRKQKDANNSDLNASKKQTFE